MRTTYQELLNQGIECLASAGIEEASLDAWYLLSYSLKIDRMRFLMERGRETEFAEEAVTQYRELIAARAKRIPLQQLTCEQEFMGLSFYVNEHVLIPRQDTEALVESVLELTAGSKGLRVLDMCTGSGCIAISLAALGGERFAEVTGVDLSEEALKVAAENQKRLNVDVKWRQSDMFADILPVKVDVIVSNPPYIRPEVIEGLMPEVRDHEPRMALDGGDDGLDFYRILAVQAGEVLQAGGLLAVEIGHDQGEDVAALFQAAGLTDIEVRKDLAGLDRVVLGVLK